MGPATGCSRPCGSTPRTGSPRRAAPRRSGSGTRWPSFTGPNGNTADPGCRAITTTSGLRWSGPWLRAVRLGRGWLTRSGASGSPGGCWPRGGTGWNARAQPLADESLRAGLLRLLGATLFESGDLARAEAVLTEGSAAAATACASALQARIGVLLADIRNMQGRSNADTLAECQAATAVLEAEGDLIGLAEAWMLTGRTLFWLDD